MISLHRKTKCLEEIRDGFIVNNGTVIHGKRLILSKHWDDLTAIAESIVQACRWNNLADVASNTRRLKNKLRKRIFKLRLEDLEKEDSGSKSDKNTGTKGSEKDGKKGEEVNGQCVCDKCKAKIDVPNGEPCIDGALCPSCALKRKDVEVEKTECIVESALRRRLW